MCFCAFRRYSGCMNPLESLYFQILGLTPPWTVAGVRLIEKGGVVEVGVHARDPDHLECPLCGTACPRYDHAIRRWRHLDTCQYETVVVGEVPRVKCAEHGVLRLPVPWAEPGSRFTALFEVLVIEWLREASINAVTRQMGLKWNQVQRIQKRAVERGLDRRTDISAARIGIDETSFRKARKFMTIVSDADSPEVLHVAPGCGKDSAVSYFDKIGPGACRRIEAVGMDMSKAYIAAVKERVPGWRRKICFDRFHVSQHLGNAVDKVRREEHRKLLERGDRTLTGTKYVWLKNPENNRSVVTGTAFEILREMALETSKAWSFKEHARHLWELPSRKSAAAAWRHWIGCARKSAIGPIMDAAGMVSRHLYGIVNAVVKRVTNAGAESINARIQHVKRMSCGFRNKDNFAAAIYFHLGGLDMYPDSCRGLV